MVYMLVTMETCLRKVLRQLEWWGNRRNIRAGARVLLYGGSGWLTSALGLPGGPLPLAMGLVCAATGWRALVTALGAGLGYRMFWGDPGTQGIVWSAAGCLLALVLGKGDQVREMPLLIPALSASAVAVTGLTFLFFQRGGGFSLFLLRLFLAPVSAWGFRRVLQGQENPRPRGDTGILQVRLELTAGVLSQFQRLLLEIRDPPVDEEALLHRAVSRICGSCPARLSCQERHNLSLEHLQDPLSFTCRRPGDIHPELLCSRERLRSLRADRLRRQEYRSALVQQYRFLAVYLQNLSDQLPRRGEIRRPHYKVEVSARSRGKEPVTGDRCMAFPGVGLRYYILLCDGMGTGPGAAREGQEAGRLLKAMLTAGFPAEFAFRSFNSMLALSDRAGAVTLDLAELRLDSGGVKLYKWGASPSFRLGKAGAEKIGTATPPPGIRVTDVRETVVRLSLRRGEMLILVSDGLQAGECLGRVGGEEALTPGDLAQRLLEECGGEEDDATVAVVRLLPRRTST